MMIVWLRMSLSFMHTGLALVLTASMEDHFAADIMDFEQTHQMWSFLH
jgi:hypothetical protein